MENSPFLEKLRKRGYEVLFMVDPIDEYVVQQLKVSGRICSLHLRFHVIWWGYGVPFMVGPFDEYAGAAA